ncbi:MAG: nucleotidyltransferase family protein [Tannerella sp.]|jgi:D-glycero-alpha-D-manno-heptose 1-phosphate guanylyltransferase|nr:nucleotidyltransferase family protein [Tannerella sp.]
MEVIILAGGLGTRLRPAVGDLPKCMAPVCNRPFLYYILLYLSRYKTIRKIILALGYRHEIIVNWIEQLQEFEFEYIFSIEDAPLGTGGAIKRALKCTTSDRALVLNGDTMFKIDLDHFARQHSQRGTRLSVALKPMKNFDRYGNVEINEQSLITTFEEKKHCVEGRINGGIYLLSEKEWMNECPENFSFETEVLQPQVKHGDICGFVYDDYFIDIGVAADYARAQNEFNRLFCNELTVNIGGYGTLF